MINPAMIFVKPAAMVCLVLLTDIMDYLPSLPTSYAILTKPIDTFTRVIYITNKGLI